MDQTTAPPTTTIGDAAAALAYADSSSATPATPDPSATTPPAATTPATETATETQVPVSADPQSKKQTRLPDGTFAPPEERWPAILENQRKKAAEETEARVRQELEQQYSGLKDFSSIDADQRNGLLVWHAALSGNPQAIAFIRSNPQFVATIRGLIAEQTQATQDQEPGPDYEVPQRDQAGNIVGHIALYSAEQQAKREAWLKRQISDDFRKEIQPLQQVAQTFQQREAQAAYTNAAASVIAKMKAADPVFEKHMADVSAVIQADPKLFDMATRPDHPDPETALEIAWARVYRSKVLPAQHQQTEAQVLTDLQKRAVAATTNPATASSATPKSTLGDARAALDHAYAVTGST